MSYRTYVKQKDGTLKGVDKDTKPKPNFVGKSLKEKQAYLKKEKAKSEKSQAPKTGDKK